MVYLLSLHDKSFPKNIVNQDSDIVAMGGDFSAKRLINAYRAGIFPWPHKGYPILWFCPDPRFVLEPQKLHIGKSLKKSFKRNNLRIVFDQNFSGVMKFCQKNYRKSQDDTWISDDMCDGYQKLFNMGYAHSIEAYEGSTLVGGLYGVALGKIFFGESMFFIKPDASKIAFMSLIAHLKAWGFSLIDCQSYTDHLARFGAHHISKQDFLRAITSNDDKNYFASYFLKNHQILEILAA